MNNLAQPGDTLPVGQYNNGLLILFIKVKQMLLFFFIKKLVLLNLLFVQEVLTLRVVASCRSKSLNQDHCWIEKFCLEKLMNHNRGDQSEDCCGH